MSDTKSTFARFRASVTARNLTTTLLMPVILAQAALTFTNLSRAGVDILHLPYGMGWTVPVALDGAGFMLLPIIHMRRTWHVMSRAASWSVFLYAVALSVAGNAAEQRLLDDRAAGRDTIAVGVSVTGIVVMAAIPLLYVLVAHQLLGTLRGETLRAIRTGTRHLRGVVRVREWLMPDDAVTLAAIEVRRVNRAALHAARHADKLAKLTGDTAPAEDVTRATETTTDTVTPRRRDTKRAASRHAAAPASAADRVSRGVDAYAVYARVGNWPAVARELHQSVRTVMRDVAAARDAGVVPVSAPPAPAERKPSPRPPTMAPVTDPPLSFQRTLQLVETGVES